MPKYFSHQQIVNSIAALANVHPFHGITFLVCKQDNLPVGESKEFKLDAKTDAFLNDYHRLDPTSDWFFQPFKSNVREKKWVSSDYSSSGLQAINTQTFITAFLHERKSRLWGWSADYISVLKSRLPKQSPIPAFHLAVWLFRSHEWPEATTVSDVILKLINDFHITDDERLALFDTAEVQSLPFQDTTYSWDELRKLISPAPDSKPDQGGTLAYLETRGLGPAQRFALTPAERLTLITGDNGLGKTFLLECCWWALTGVWAERPAMPNPNAKIKSAEITFSIEGERSKAERKTINFDWKTLSWPQPKIRPTIPGLIVYARVDGSFAVWDPVKQAIVNSSERQTVFSSSEIWNGLQGSIEGLIRDWIRWQTNPAKYPFETFKEVLAKLSPPDLGVLEPGDSVRIPGDPRDIPTIKHRHEVVPIVYSSAGVRRIITLAYLTVWAWNEHVVAAELARTKPQRRMVVLVDEMEAHLHPRWQRVVLPALMSIGEMLSTELEIQFIVATHSPMVMASSETVFDSNLDSLVHLDLAESGEVSLSEIDFIKFGDASAWLTSPVFNLRQARSTEAESAIEDAKILQLQENISGEEVRKISERLIRYLSADDKFWPRWIYFAEQHGINL